MNHSRINLEGIENIIFDLGGVILDLDVAPTNRKFEKIFGKDFKQLVDGRDDILDLFKQFEKGLLSAVDFRNTIRNATSVDFTDEVFDDAWNAMLLELNPNRLELLEKWHRQYRMFLLSNTNEIHITYFRGYLLQHFGMNDLDAYFEKLYYSNEIKICKPELSAFRLVIDENRLNPDKTLFIDDTLVNIEAARQVGLMTFYKDRFRELLEFI
jgi:putative hydrolase of the HAD superfamily